MKKTVTFLFMGVLGHILAPIEEHAAQHYVPENPKYVSLGCWKDDIPSAMNDREWNSYGIVWNSEYMRKNIIQKCFDLAMSNALRFFAIQDGGKCFFGCPKTAELWSKGAGQCTSEWKIYGPSSECLGDGKGGPMANDVYHIELDPCFDKDVGVVITPCDQNGCVQNLIRIKRSYSDSYSIMDCQTLCQSTSSCMIFDFARSSFDGHAQCMLFSSENGRQDEPRHITGPKYCNSTMLRDTYIEDYSAKQCKERCGESCEKMPLKIDLVYTRLDLKTLTCHKTWAMRYCKTTCRLRLALLK